MVQQHWMGKENSIVRDRIRKRVYVEWLHHYKIKYISLGVQASNSGAQKVETGST